MSTKALPPFSSSSPKCSHQLLCLAQEMRVGMWLGLCVPRQRPGGVSATLLVWKHRKRSCAAACLWRQVSLCGPAWSGVHRVVQADRKLMALLPEHSKCWNCSHEPQDRAFLPYLPKIKDTYWLAFYNFLGGKSHAFMF